MKKILLFIFCFFIVFVSFGQKKPNTIVNPQTNALKIISKVLENINISEDDGQSRKIEGGHRTGIYSGRSEFKFLIFGFGLIKLEVVSSIYSNGSINRQREAYSELTNYKFINSGGAYGTKMITADWDGYSAKFMMKLTNDKGIDEVYVSIKGESNWEHWTRISVNETQFQELVNNLSVSKIPQNVEKQKAILLKEITLLETQERIRKFNAPIDNEDYLKIIGKTIKIGNLLVAQYDFPDNLSWEDAKTACVSLGKGWRLPTKVELNILYLNKKKIGGFNEDGSYWSSTIYNSNNAWSQYLGEGTQTEDHRYYSSIHVRAVRTN
jgi:hypothetical protein